jgi:hypothetical protein
MNHTGVEQRITECRIKSHSGNMGLQWAKPVTPHMNAFSLALQGALIPSVDAAHRPMMEEMSG